MKISIRNTISLIAITITYSLPFLWDWYFETVVKSSPECNDQACGLGWFFVLFLTILIATLVGLICFFINISELKKDQHRNRFISNMLKYLGLVPISIVAFYLFLGLIATLLN